MGWIALSIVFLAAILEDASVRIAKAIEKKK
jgi:hypothetical protein